MITKGVDKVKPAVKTCGKRSIKRGGVRVRVKVSPDGRVANVSVETAPDPALGKCVAAAMRSAVFAKTSGGGSFAYPFVF